MDGATPSIPKVIVAQPQFNEWNIEYEEYLYNKPLELNAQLVYEVGVCVGHSTKVILQALEHTGGRLVSCDIRPTRPVQSERWTFIQIDSTHFPAYLDEEADMIYIDGDHEFGAVRRDVIKLWPFLKVGGQMVLDDIQTFPHGPGEVLKRLQEAGLDAYCEPVANGFGILRKREEDPDSLEGAI